MPRRPKPEEIDFDIHVDNSCLSAPNEDDDYEQNDIMSERGDSMVEGVDSKSRIEELESQIREQLGDIPATEESKETPKPTVSDAVDDSVTMTDDEDHMPEETSVLSEHSAEEPAVSQTHNSKEGAVEDEVSTSQSAVEPVELNDEAVTSDVKDFADQPPSEVVEEPVVEVHDEEPASTTEDDIPESLEGPEEDVAMEKAFDESPDATEAPLELEQDAVEELEELSHIEGQGTDARPAETAGPTDESLLETHDDALDTREADITEEPSEEVTQSVEGDSMIEHDEDENVDESFITQDDDNSDRSGQSPDSRRESGYSVSSEYSHRRSSGRTEALIAAAARNIVAQIEKVQLERESQNSTPVAQLQPEAEEGEDTSKYDHSFVSETGTADVSMPIHDQLDDEQSFLSEVGTADLTRGSDAHSLRSTRSEARSDQTAGPINEDGAESSSHNENEDDVFSEHSPRSSVGSASELDLRKVDDNVTRRSRSVPKSPQRTGRMSIISGISQYEQEEEEEDDYMPTIRGMPRPPFRSPSSVKAMQMSSPPASVFGSPRSSRRAPLPNRLGSPGVSAQYSPKRTPPRFKRNSPPLVLLHVTLLPLRWPWADVLESAHVDQLSPEGKNLRDAWRQLQDHMGDTTCERGILLPHPQNDYEVLEERLLEALELPLRRRARILECGHYLGPANDTAINDSESEEDSDGDNNGSRSCSPSRSGMHWCATCRASIRYDSLGAGKVFRVKVYASNGLMKAGAWDTCWKEMERVDVELEPLVESSVHNELSRLELEQRCALELREEQEQRDEEVQYIEEEESAGEQPCIEEPSPVPEPEPEMLAAPLVQEHRPLTPTPEEERRLRDEERLREIYGQTPPAHPAVPSPGPSYMDPDSPPSPSSAAFERRQERSQSRQPMQNESLPELLLQSVRVLMQDRKNVVILVMSLLVGFLALKGGDQPAVQGVETLVERDGNLVIETVPEMMINAESEVILQESVVPETQAEIVVRETISDVETDLEAKASQESSVDPLFANSVLESATEISESAGDISESGHQQEHGPVVSTEIVRIIETVTQTAIETVTQTYLASESTRSSALEEVEQGAVSSLVPMAEAAEGQVKAETVADSDAVEFTTSGDDEAEATVAPLETLESDKEVFTAGETVIEEIEMAEEEVTDEYSEQEVKG